MTPPTTAAPERPDTPVACQAWGLPPLPHLSARPPAPHLPRAPSTSSAPLPFTELLLRRARWALHLARDRATPATPARTRAREEGREGDRPGRNGAA
ncbi:hypothetical protein ACN20G_35470 (plasmid) [Streptomyces sp. BI20]|uniref:hypothetical protein n=1 Tax=Streptomyces sp. BI20 TaxID=3403460 RepID=UPI003C79493B